VHFEQRQEILISDLVQLVAREHSLGFITLCTVCVSPHRTKGIPGGKLRKCAFVRMLRTIYTQLLFETRLTYEFNQTGAPSEKENYGETPPGD
jgi:hypothetical protein